jgi:hypothetical protein
VKDVTPERRQQLAQIARETAYAFDPRDFTATRPLAGRREHLTHLVLDALIRAEATHARTGAE